MTAAIIQARMNSSRLPGKVLKVIHGKSILQILIERVKKIKNVDKIIIATTKDKSDDKLTEFAEDNNLLFYRGDTDNVLQRYIDTADNYNVNTIVRICADTPLIAPELIDEMILKLINNECDYCGLDEKYPCAATGVEVFTKDALIKQKDFKLENHHKEHVSVMIRENSNFKKCYVIPKKELQHDIRLTIDTQADFDLMTKILGHFDNNAFSLAEAVKFLNSNPELKKINAHVKQKDIHQPSIKAGLIVKTIENELKNEFTKVFTEKYNIGFDVLYVSLVNPKFDWAKFAEEAAKFDYIFFDKSLDNLTFTVPSQAVDLNITKPELLAKKIKSEFNI